MSLLMAGLTAAVAAGLESTQSTGPDSSLTCEEDGVHVSNWDVELVDGRIDAVTIADIGAACSGTEIAATVADASGIHLATTDATVLTDTTTAVTLPFSTTRPHAADVEELDVFVVGSGEPGEPGEPTGNRVVWDGGGPADATGCSGEVHWRFELSGKVQGYRADLTAVFATAGTVGPAPMDKSGNGRATTLVTVVTTPGGDLLEDAWVTLNKTPDPSMILSLLDVECSGA